MHSETSPRVAIIAYGNPLRSDDGIGWHLAQLLQNEQSNCLTELICVHQLTPEIAENAAGAVGVIFVDASQTGEPGEICFAPAEAEKGEELFSHTLCPGQILALTERLYGKRPLAFAVSVAGESFDHGDALSETLRNALPVLVRTVKDLVSRLSRQLDPSTLEQRDACAV